MQKLCLTRAALADAKAIHRMQHESFWPLHLRWRGEAATPALALLSQVRRQIASANSAWYLIQRDGATLGALRVLRERTEEGQPCCRISPLFVLPAHQGKGVGHAALQAVFRLYPEAAQWHASAILQEHAAVHFFEDMCFRRRMTEPAPNPGMDYVHLTRLREDSPGGPRLALLTDRDLLGTEGLSHAAPRWTARAILRGPRGLYAVTHTEGFGIYMLPGGGVEAEESILTALHREIAEETGCRISSAMPLGYVEENRAHADYTQRSFYFLAETADEELHPHLTAAEAEHGTTVSWMTMEEMWTRISEPVFDRPQGKFLQARDVAALRAVMELAQG